MIRASVVGGLALLAGLSGCATLPETGLSPRTFDVLGRLSASHQGRAFSSGFRWQSRAGQMEVWLLTPVGQVLAHITAGSSGATLVSADQTEYSATSLGSLTERALGWSLPLGHLSYWIDGRPVPEMTVISAARDRGGRLAEFEQDGWRVNLSYEEDTVASLPRRIDAERQGQRIRVVVDQRRPAVP